MLRNLLRMPFYAVANGRTPGIYKTWAECESQVKGFKAAKYKKFNTEAEAKNFVTGVPSLSSNSKKRPSEALSSTSSAAPATKRFKSTKTAASELPTTKIVGLKSFGKHTFPVDSDDFVHVYTDGSCEGNGSTIACAGLGIYFMDGHALNTAKPVLGRPTNNSGEIQAIILAIQLAKANSIKKLQINTDSMYVINAVTQWMPAWKRKNWKKTGGGELKNLEDFQKLDKELNSNEIQVRWNHVAGHAGIQGNEGADKLAREGAQMYRDAKKSAKK
ncbi:ribonuclease H1 [Culicoides brevitarsis]|uniref:ribonuclease H1 n=1 Tax=Culicoides brevitarsis TaxID=469753 RepID=UPI00307C6A1C